MNLGGYQCSEVVHALREWNLHIVTASMQRIIHLWNRWLTSTALILY